MSLLSVIGSIAAPIVGGLFGNSAAKSGANATAQGQAAANAANYDIANLNNQTVTANANRANDLNAQTWQATMDWQTYQNNTAHQREVADLEAAGLNPILSAGGSGAPSGGGASFTAQTPNLTVPHMENTAAEFASTGRQLASNYSDMGKAVGDQIAKSPLVAPSIENAKLENLRLLEQIKQMQISNAQQGVYTPLYKKAGDAIQQGVDYLTGKRSGVPDVIQEVLNAGAPVTGGAAATGNNVPNSALSITQIAKQQANNFADRFVGNSQARQYMNGDKSLMQSILDSGKEEVARNNAKNLTPQQIKTWAKNKYNVN